MSSNPVAHQFDDLQQQSTAAQLGMWIFLITEVMFFGGMFTCYAVYRVKDPSAFAEGSQHLQLFKSLLSETFPQSVWLAAWLDWPVVGTANTALLLTSSLTMALAALAAKAGCRRGTTHWLIATAALGTIFLAVKFAEYEFKFQAGLMPGVSFHLGSTEGSGIDPRHVELFFSFYFVMTGLHALHMLIGIVILCIFARLANLGSFLPEYHTHVAILGLYWHFVDVIWIFLFPLLYLI